MADNPIKLEALIAHVLAEHPDTDALQHLADAVEVSTHLGEIADHLIGHFVDEARTEGASWTEIGSHMGVTKQAVQKRFVPKESEDPDFPEGGRLSRFTPRARHTVQAARKRAASTGSTHVTNTHLLLGLLTEPDGLAGKAIEAVGVPIATVETTATATLSARRRRAARSVNFSREAKKTLELSLREALRLEHNYIGTEHLLLGLLRNAGDPAVALLERLGVTHDGAEAEIRKLLEAVVAQRRADDTAQRRADNTAQRRKSG
jgi:hypothetical protein